MQKLIYNSFANSVSHIHYDIKLARLTGEFGNKAVIHIYQPKHSGTSLINGDEYRDDIINRILGHDLKGVVLDNIRAIYTIPKNEDEYLNIEYKLLFHIDQVKKHTTYPRAKFMQRLYLRFGKTVEQCCHSLDVRAGEITVFTDPDQCRNVPDHELPTLGIDVKQLKNLR